MKTKASAELLLSSQTSCRVLVIGIGKKNNLHSLIENQLIKTNNVFQFCHACTQEEF